MRRRPLRKLSDPILPESFCLAKMPRPQKIERSHEWRMRAAFRPSVLTNCREGMLADRGLLMHAEGTEFEDQLRHQPQTSPTCVRRFILLGRKVKTIAGPSPGMTLHRGFGLNLAASHSTQVHSYELQMSGCARMCGVHTASGSYDIRLRLTWRRSG